MFERLESASIRSVWAKIAEDREYQLPVLKDLGLVDLGPGPRQWVLQAEQGVKSLHLISDEVRGGTTKGGRIREVTDVHPCPVCIARGYRLLA